MTYIEIDNKTLFLLAIVICLSLSFITALFRILYSRTVIFTYLLVGNLFFTLSYVSTYTGSLLGGFRLSVLVGFSEVMAIMMWTFAVKEILSVKKNAKVFVFLNFIHVLLLFVFTLIIPNPSIRRFITQLLFAIILFETSYRLIKHSKSFNLKSHQVVSFSFVLFGGYKMTMSIYRLFAKLNISSVFDANLSVSFFNITAIVFAILMNLSIIVLQHDKLQEQIKEISVTDPLTRIYNRRYFMSRFDEVLELCRKNRMKTFLLLIDIDNFKKVNDNYGHNIGDEVLIEISCFLKSQIAKSDILARYGGEEFILIIEENTMQGFQSFIDHMYEALSENVFSTEALRITVSGGAIQITQEMAMQNQNKIISVADERLYRAKEMGKDRTIIN